MYAYDRSACLLLFFCFGLTSGAPLQNASADTSYDLIIFTQHWPQTVCFTWREKNNSHTCSLRMDEEWSIHGIWPSQLHKIAPQNCNPLLKFNASALRLIEEELNVKWLNIETETKHYSLWRHEWEKHGTCSVDIEMMNTEEKYFQEGLRLYDTYDMKHVLAKASILPGGEYAPGDILNGVKKVLGKTCQVTCVKDPKTKASYLSEVRICLDKQLQLIDCDDIAGYPTNCDASASVTYPSTVPYTYHVVQT